MSEFYTNVAIRGDNILLRGYRDGKSIKEKIPFQPTLYIPSLEKTNYKTLDGRSVEPINPGSINDCRNFVKKYQGVSNIEIFGNTDYIYQFIGDNYSGDVDYDISSLRIANIDIETTCENGFPDINNPTEQVIAISLKINRKTFVFGLGDYDIVKDNVECFKFDSEEDLLISFIECWEIEKPDIVTGWNIRFFDIPFLVNRICSLLGDSFAKRISPWGVLKTRDVTKMGRTQTVYEILGISTLDYYELYTTFTYTNQESYKLDHIAYVELNERKLSYKEYDSMSDFYKQDFQKFMEYNLKDVELVDRLEGKLKLIELAVALAYSAKVNYMDVYSQVRTWDCIIYQYLNEHNVVISQKKHKQKDSQYEGAYVKDPITGMHDWIVSFDLNSLYPHLIMQYNISPETKITGVTPHNKDYMITPNGILKEDNDRVLQALTKLTDKGYSVAANGTCYTKKIRGFLPALMERLYKERKMYKNKMIEAQKLQQDIPKMNMPNLGRHALNERCKNDIAKYNNFQLVRKIQLNSAYGAIGNQYFRYFDIDMAEAITLSGQLSIRWIANKLNEFLNETIGTKDYDYVVASDTDSVYLRLGNLVNKVCPSDATKQKVVEFLNKASEEIILPFIENQYDELASMMNAFENKMVMDRECIADKGIWTAKKRYMLNVHDSEGIRYEDPKLKIMGIETTRSSTPEIVRKELKDLIRLVLLTDEETVIRKIEEVRTKFFESPPEDISFPRGVNGLNKYRDNEGIYKKSTPIAVKGALIYNHYLDKLNLNKKYPRINEGDKIKFIYLNKPNPLGGQAGMDHVVSFPTKIPSEFSLDGFIDYEKQFQKSFLDPLKTILNSVGWKHEKINTLEGLFV